MLERGTVPPFLALRRIREIAHGIVTVARQVSQRIDRGHLPRILVIEEAVRGKRRYNIREKAMLVVEVGCAIAAPV